MSAPFSLFTLPVGQWIDLDGKLLRYARRGRDRERRLVFEGVDEIPVDMTDAELLDLQQTLPPRLKLLTAAEASDRLNDVGRPRVTILDNDPGANDDARRRLDYIRGWEAAGCPPRTEEGLGPVVAAVLTDRRAREVKPADIRAPSPRQVSRWIADYLNAGGDINSLVPQAANKGNGQPRLSLKARSILNEVLDEWYFRDTMPTAVAAYAHVVTAFEDYNRPLPDGDKLPVPSLMAAYRYIRTNDHYIIDCSRKGRRAADLAYRPKGSAPQTTRHNEVWEIDHTQVDAIVVDEKSRLPIGRPWVTAIIDRHTRMVMGLYISFNPPGTYSTLQCVRNAILSKDKLLASCPSVQGPWPCIGTPEVLIPDQGREFKARTFVEGMLSIGVDVQYTPVLKAWYKGKIERFFRTLAQDVFHRVPGTTFANVFARNKEDIPEKVAVVTLAELRLHAVHFIVDVYHQRTHRGLGTSPLKAWQESVERHGLRPLPNAERILAALSQVIYRKPQAYGIEYEGLIYNSAAVAAVRIRPGPAEAVRIAVNPHDLTTVRFVDPATGEFVEVPIQPSMRDRVRGVTLEKHKLARALQLANEKTLRGEAGIARAYSMIDRAMEAHGRQGGLANRRDAARYWEAIQRARKPEDDPAFDQVGSAATITDGLFDEVVPTGNGAEVEAPAADAAPEPATAAPPKHPDASRRKAANRPVLVTEEITPDVDLDLEAEAARLGMNLRVSKD